MDVRPPVGFRTGTWWFAGAHAARPGLAERPSRASNRARSAAGSPEDQARLTRRPHPSYAQLAEPDDRAGWARSTPTGGGYRPWAARLRLGRCVAAPVRRVSHRLGVFGA